MPPQENIHYMQERITEHYHLYQVLTALGLDVLPKDLPSIHRAAIIDSNSKKTQKNG